jgi:hypothetical protein
MVGAGGGGGGNADKAAVEERQGRSKQIYIKLSYFYITCFYYITTLVSVFFQFHLAHFTKYNILFILSGAPYLL